VATSHRDLRAWKRADGIRQRIIALCARPAVKRDFKFCDQADSAAASACRNIAEGFARYRHADFARFIEIARSSLNELIDSLDEAATKGYIEATEHKDLERAIRAAMVSTNVLRRYLQNTLTPKERRARRRKPGSGESSAR
jgi:four helix bundle protein